MAKEQLPPPTRDQKAAWSFYGTPNAPSIDRNGTNVRKNVAGVEEGKQVGEVRYVVGWMADQMVRMGWRLKIDGSSKWKVRTNGGEIVTSDPDDEGDPQASEKHPMNASARLLREIMWDSRTVREVTTNLFVAGELHYAQDGESWRVVSVIRPDRDEIMARAKLKVRGIWPHPGDPEAPDAPLFGVLSVLDDMWWLNRLSRSQSANRVGMRGIVGIADTFEVANAPGGNLWQHFEESLGKPMDDPTDVSPVGLVGAKDLVQPKDNGMMGFSWIVPDFPYDDKVDERMHSLVQRLAYGLPIPPEILLGMQAQSKATAFQVEGSTYRAHIEPVAMLIAKVATDALSQLLPGVGEIEVVPDPTVLLARRHSVQDVMEAFDRGAASGRYLREVLGIPEGAAPDADELAQRKAGRQPAPSDPANDAAQEPITAAARMPAEGAVVKGTDAELFDTQDSQRLSSALHAIDSTLFAELVGAAHGAVSRSHERLGARVRASTKLRGAFPDDLTNEDLGRDYAEQIMEALGVDGEKIVNAALDPTLRWWKTRLGVAMSQTAQLIGRGGSQVEWPPNAELTTVLKLHEVLTTAVAGRPLSPQEAVTAAGEVRGLRESDLRAVLDLSDGAGEPGVAMGGAARRALLAAGVQVIGHRWQWNPGRKGGIFDPHLERDGAAVFNVEGFVGDNAGEWGALPGQGINAGYCMCSTRWLLRGADGRFMKEAPGASAR